MYDLARYPRLRSQKTEVCCLPFFALVFSNSFHLPGHRAIHPFHNCRNLHPVCPQSPSSLLPQLSIAMLRREPCLHRYMVLLQSGTRSISHGPCKKVAICWASLRKHRHRLETFPRNPRGTYASSMTIV